MSQTVIFANGVLRDPQRVRVLVHPFDVILCADGGTRHALALSLSPNFIIGDLDSLDAADRHKAEAAGAAILLHPRDKDETDLELALSEALKQKNARILIIGALGNRLDHTLGNIAMLSDPALAGLDVRLDDGLEEVLVCRGRAHIEGDAGDLVSLLPWGGPVDGIRTSGLKWPLNGESLLPEKTRGVSNEMLGGSVTIDINSGLLLIIHRRQTQAENRATETERTP